jgi:hypothetical protein
VEKIVQRLSDTGQLSNTTSSTPLTMATTWGSFG